MSYGRTMSQDRRSRRLGRSPDDPAARARYARELTRQGQWRLLSTADLLDQQLVSPERIALARRVLEADWRGRLSSAISSAIRDAAGLLERTLSARLAADYAAHVPQENFGRASIEAARAWANDPTEENRLAVAEARDDARGAAGPFYSYSAVYAADGAALAALNTAYFASEAAHAVNSAYYAAFYAALAALDAADAERNWQQWRLVRYLVAPDWPTPVPITDRPDEP